MECPQCKTPYKEDANGNFIKDCDCSKAKTQTPKSKMDRGW